MPKLTNFCSDALFRTKMLYIFPYYGIIDLRLALKRTSILIRMQHNVDYVLKGQKNEFIRILQVFFR